jgi:hypothetical protein
MENINSGEDYARLVIDTIVEGELEFSEKERLDSRLLSYWCDEIRKYAEKTWREYIIGDRDTYIFSDVEFRDLFEKAGLRYASDILDGLVDKEMVSMGVRNDGELVYSVTQKGKKHLDEEM